MKLTLKTQFALPTTQEVLYEKFPDIVLLAYMVFVYVWNYSVGFNPVIKYGIHAAALVVFFLLAIFKFKCVIISSFEKNFLLFIAFCCVSIFFAISQEQAAAKCLNLVVYLLIAGSIHVYITKKNKLEWLMRTLCFGGIALAFYNLYFYGVGNYVSSMLSGNRVGGEIMNLNVIGQFCCFSALICSWYAIYKNKIRYVAPMILCTFIALGVGSRKSLSALVLGFCLLYLFRGNLREKLKNFVMVVLFLSAFLMILQLPIFERTTSRFEAMFNSSARVDNSTYLRGLLIEHGLEDFTSSPLMGVGIGNTPFLGVKYTGYEFYMHNNYVELLVSVGIIGTAIYYLLLLYPLIKLFRPALRQDPMAILLEVILLLMLFMDFGEVTYDSIETYFWILAAHVKVKELEEFECQQEKFSIRA